MKGVRDRPWTKFWPRSLALPSLLSFLILITEPVANPRADFRNSKKRQSGEGYDGFNRARTNPFCGCERANVQVFEGELWLRYDVRFN
jgi:hypothetical protein